MAESQGPDYVFSDIEKVTSCKLIDENEDEKAQAIVVRISLGLEE